ncbi:helix-turn-helix transcriptional regulator [Pseudactinotalea sp.]|uniref:helix-turn-helix transcriptional regulator n=1 Tax=Pseudactinotalea sp. TaxID=1926260 RepID=UPI003B3B6496
MLSPEAAASAAGASRQRTRPEGIRGALENGQHVVVLGEAGIGKTHLVNAALRDGPPPGTRVVDLNRAVLGGTRSGDRGPLDHLLEAGGARHDPEAAADALWAWSTSDGAAARVLVRLEAAQLVDDVALDVVTRLVARPEVTLVATSRADPSLGRMFTGLTEASRFTVRPLDTAGVETLLVELLGGFPTADTVHRFWVASRGNPFYLCELVRDQRERQMLVCDDGIWVWTGVATLSPRLLDSALHDLGHLAQDERDAVELAAISGPIPAAQMTDQIRDRLLRLGMLRPSPAGDEAGAQYEVVHPILADAICALIGTRRRRQLLIRADQWGQRERTAADDPVRLVSRSIDAQLDVSVPRLLRACGVAVRADDPHAALELTSAALLRATAGSEAVAILTARADAHLHLGDTEAALTDLAEARTALEAPDADGEYACDAYVRTVRLEAMVRHFLGSALGPTLTMLEVSARWLKQRAGGSESAARAVEAVEALRLAHMAWGGRHPEMLDLAVETLHAAEHPEDVVPLVGPTIFAMALAGRPTEAEQLSQQFLPVIAEHPGLHRWEPATFTLARFFTLVLAGEITLAASTGPLGRGMIDMVSRHQRGGVLAAARADWVGARHDLRAANARLRRRDSLGILSYTLAVEAMVAAASGEALSARTLLDELDATPRRCSQVAGAYLDLYALDTLIWMQDAGASLVAARLARAAARDGQWAIELEALHRVVVTAGLDAAREVLSSGSLADRVTWLSSRVQGRRNSALVAHLCALIARQPRQVAEASASLHEVGVHLPGLAPAARLTRREREIAVLAAGGMTSKAIAQRLVLSVRTIDSHLAGAYAKLGVHSRDGLQQSLAVAPG